HEVVIEVAVVILDCARPGGKRIRRRGALVGKTSLAADPTGDLDVDINVLGNEVKYRVLSDRTGRTLPVPDDPIREPQIWQVGRCSESPFGIRRTSSRIAALLPDVE